MKKLIISLPTYWAVYSLSSSSFPIIIIIMSSTYLASTSFGSLLGTYPSMTSLILTITLVDKSITDAHQYLCCSFSWRYWRLHFSASPWLGVAMCVVLTVGQGREVVCATFGPKHSTASWEILYSILLWKSRCNLCVEMRGSTQLGRLNPWDAFGLQRTWHE